VQPDDVLAKQRHNSFGKTEMWYVIHASENASLYSGFKDALTPEKYIESVENNTFTDKLQEYKVQAGDVFFLPAGRVHAIRSGCFIAEIQQTSDITYRIYDYNRKDAQGRGRELHTALAKDAIDYNVYPEGYKTHYTAQKNVATPLVSCPYFTTRLIEGNKAVSRDFSTTDSFVIYICMEGKITLKDANGYAVDVKQGESVLVPAAVKNTISLSPASEYRVLETFISTP
jgi:mannose-6-phosphate isomerase